LLASVKPPLLLIHGAFTHSSRWDAWVGFFTEAGYHCVAPSLPAHDPPDRRALADLGFDDYVQALKDVVAQFDQPPVLIGHSMGGLLAQHLAAEVGCRGMVLVSSPPPWRVMGTRHLLPYSWRYALPVIAGRAIRVNEAAARNLVLHDLSEAEQNEMVNLFSWESGRAYRTMVLGLAPIERNRVRCPVLCVSGGSDRMLRLATVKSLAAFYDAEHIVFPHRGHSLVGLSMIGDVGNAVLEWIERVPAREAAEGSFTQAAVV